MMKFNKLPWQTRAKQGKKIVFPAKIFFAFDRI